MRILRGAAVMGLVAASLGSASIGRTRNLTLEERIRAQEAIERVYYTHQIGATGRFEVAVPRALLEKKVKAYLQESVALEALWKTPVTSGMLHRELERMAGQTRMPERLRELYAALENDPLLIQECLARPALVDRLARNFYAYDTDLHAGERREAESLREDLALGRLNPGSDHAQRRVVNLVRLEAGSAGLEARGEPSAGREVDPFRLEIQPDAFDRYRARLPALVGEIGSVQEERNAFVIHVILSEAEGEIKLAKFSVPKRSWDSWWSSASSRFEETSSKVAASVADYLPFPESGRSDLPEATCLADDTWDNGSLDDPAPRANHTTVWTGSLMVVWGGWNGSTYFSTGGRYDPATDTWTFVSANNAPSPRQGHTAVWTGSRMIMWGGTDGTSYFDTGGQYNPVADTWTPTAMANAPSPRRGHTAVWTGSRMVVWGGSSGSASLDSGGRYNPATDTWTPTSTSNAPHGRDRHAAVWTGSLMVVWGGYDNFAFPNFLNTGGRYDPAADTWTPTTTLNAPVARSGHTAVWTGSLMVVWGGYGGGYLNTGGRYNPATDTWTPTSTSNGVPSGRLGHGAVWTGSLMVVWGGWDVSTYFSTGGRYDPTTDSWAPTSTSNAPSARADHGVVWTGSKVVVWGGWNRTSLLDSGGRYDPATDSWTPTSTFQTASPRSGHTAVWTGGRVVVWGGTDGSTFLADGGRYDPALDTWTPTTLTGAPLGRFGHTAVWTSSRMVVWGGVRGEESCGNFCDGDYCCIPYDVYLGDGGRYDPTTDLWTPVSGIGAPSARAFHTAAWTGSLMVVWGGFDSIDLLNTGGRYDPATDTWAPTSQSNAPSPREVHTAVWTGTRMLVWGGMGGAGGTVYLDTGGRYDPATDTWTPMSTINAPSARQGHASVWSGSSMIVWGGFDNTYLGDGGRYDPASDSWTPTSSASAPLARRGHNAVWTGSRMVVWGGLGLGDVPLNSGNQYDPAADSWSPVSMTNAPPPRSGHASVWTGSFMLVWGGFDGSGHLDNGGRYSLGHAIDNDGDGFSECQGDCNDGSAGIHPGSAELCNGLDDNCDGAADEGSPPGGAACTVPNTFGPCTPGFTSCAAGPLTCVPTVFPSPEICDGIDNDCNGSVDDNAQTPIGSPSLSMVVFGGTAVIGWDPMPDATGYDVVKGDLSVLRGTGGNFSTAILACLADNLADSALVLSGSPAMGSGFFYLVRGTNCGGGGTYDSGSPTQVGSRDPEIAASQQACP